MYYAFPDQDPNNPNANFLSRHGTFLIFPMAIFNSVPRHFLYMYLRTSWSAVTVNVVPEIRALLFEVPANVIPETTQTTTLLVLWEGQERVMDSSPVHLHCICSAIASYQNTSVSRKDIPTSDAPTTTIRALMVTWREIQKEGLHCVLLKSLTLFSCKRVEKFQAKDWKRNRTLVKKRGTIRKY